MALYSYFADKQALLTALALEGIEKLAKRFDSTVHRDPPTALRKIVLDYLRRAPAVLTISRQHLPTWIAASMRPLRVWLRARMCSLMRPVMTREKSKNYKRSTITDRG
jgi:AcrR family transcriptional regulator